MALLKYTNKPFWKLLTTFLRTAGECSAKMPTRTDSWYSSAMKMLGVVDVLERRLVGSADEPVWGSTVGLDVIEVCLPAFTDFFLRSGLHQKYPCSRRMLGTYNQKTVIVYEIGEHLLMFLEMQSNLGHRELDSMIAYTRGLDLSAILSQCWGTFGNRLRLEYQTRNWTRTASMIPLPPRVDADEDITQKVAHWRSKISPVKSAVVLLLGPPGTGKSLFADLFSADRRFLRMDASALAGGGFSSAETIEEIRCLGPDVILIDDFCRVDSKRADILSFFEQIHTLPVTTFVSVNDASKLDSALVRSERFDWVIQFGLPSELRRRQLLVSYPKSEWLVEQTDGFNCADLTALRNRLAYQEPEDAIADIRELMGVAKAAS